MVDYRMDNPMTSFLATVRGLQAADHNIAKMQEYKEQKTALALQQKQEQEAVEHGVQLSEVVLESLDFDNHKLLICHLPDTTLIYDVSSKAWSTIKTGLQNSAHRAIDYRNEGNQITCGDKLSGLYGKLSVTSSSQYNEDQEIILYSPLIPSEGAMLFDLELTANSGLASITSRIMVSATEDGINYGIEKPVVFDGKWRWLGRSILRKIGRIRSKIGFKLRIVGATPATLSGLKVRAE